MSPIDTPVLVHAYCEQAVFSSARLYERTLKIDYGACPYPHHPDALIPDIVAIFCSAQCPGDVILTTLDLVRALRDVRTPVIGGFRTPMERERLRNLTATLFA